MKFRIGLLSANDMIVNLRLDCNFKKWASIKLFKEQENTEIFEVIIEKKRFVSLAKKSEFSPESIRTFF